MKKIYTLSLVTMVMLYIGCGSAESRIDGKIISSSNLNVNDYSIDTNFSDTVNIEFISSYTIEGSAVDIALSSDGNIAYIASGNGGLEVIDISNPRHPIYIRSFNLNEYINHVEVVGNTVYASYVTENTNAYKNISVFDISNPYNPVYLTNYEQRSTISHYKVESNDYLYMVDDTGLSMYQLDSYKTYIQVGSYTLGDHAYALAVKHGYIFIANGRDGLTILRTNLISTTNSGSFIY